MGDTVRIARSDGVATLTLDNPPLNALGHDLRSDLWAALDAVADDAGVGVVVIAAAGRSWPVGADIREFGRPPLPPGLPDLCARLAAFPKPVIAALHGMALGGGLELALAAGLRVASPDARLGLPEVTLGILPGAGGTQRLPRLIGAPAALQMMLTGAPVPAPEALAAGLVDRLAAAPGAEAVVAATQDLARTHLAGHEPIASADARLGARVPDPATWLAATAAAAAGGWPAHDRARPRIVECVEAALLLPEAQGLALERAAFLDLVDTPEARGLRHAFLAERQAARAWSAGREAAAPSRLAVVGEGAAAAALAARALRAGLAVTLASVDTPALTRMLDLVGRLCDAEVAAGRRTPDQRAGDWARLDPRPGEPGAAAQADLILECGPDDLAARRAQLSALGAALGRSLPVLSVTAVLPAPDLAAALGAGGLHGCLLAGDSLWKGGLVEVMADGASPTLAGALRALARPFGWQLLHQEPASGFIGPRLATALADAADRCLGLGATPAEIDRALRAWGFAAGPYEMADHHGRDHQPLAHPVRRDGVAPDAAALALRQDLAAAGRAAPRWHRYVAGGGWSDDAGVEAAADRVRPRARLADGVIARRVLAALANEGAWALAEGRARHAGDVDLAGMALGMARWRGGPLKAADEAGLLALRSDLRAWAASGDAFWHPAPLWSDLIRDGLRFGDLDAG